MKILQISTKNPYPPTDGGEIVTYNTIKYLAMLGHEVTLVSLVRSEKKLPELEKYCEWIPIQKNTDTTFIGLLGNLFSKTPYTISKYQEVEVKQTIRDILRKADFDIVHIDALHMAYYGSYIKREFGLPVVLREHNLETKIMERFYRNQQNPFVKLYGYLQYRKLYNYEAKLCEIFDRCFMITDKDEDRLKQMNPRVKTSVIPAGVDTSYFSPRKVKEEPNSIVSVASMDWPPNVESILWFHNKIFPRIKEKVPQVKLYIVGKNPPRKIKRLESGSVVVTGFVDDVRDYMAKGEVFIVPLKTGSGMRIKILNAMAMGKPIVSTSIGCEGIEVIDGENIYIANDEEDFAPKIMELLAEEEQRRRLGENGLKLVKAKYRWEYIVKQMEGEYKRVLEERS